MRIAQPAAARVAVGQGSEAVQVMDGFLHGSNRTPGDDLMPSADHRAVKSLSQGDLARLIPVSPEAKAGVRVLIVDDERTLRESCASVLGAEGYQVTTCSRGDEAVQKVNRRIFDIALVDLYTSQVPGMELLKAILAAHPDTIVVMITGNTSVQSSFEALQAGAWDYLPKPFTGTQLQVLVGRAAHAVEITRETRAEQERIAAGHGSNDKVTVLSAAPVFGTAI